DRARPGPGEAAADARDRAPLRPVLDERAEERGRRPDRDRPDADRVPDRPARPRARDPRRRRQVDVLCRWRIARHSLPTPRPIGDVHLRIEALPIGSLELESESGATGLGFFWSPSYPEPLPPLGELERAFAEEWPAYEGCSPFELLHRARPRGVFADAVELALWDLAAKEVGLPLYR